MRGSLVMLAEPRRKAGRMLADLRTILQSPVLRACSVGIFANGAAFAAVMPYQSLVGVGVLGIDPAVYAAVVFLSSLCAVVISIALGIAADHGFSRRATLSVALIIGIIGNGAIALSPRPEIFIIAHLFMIPVSVGVYGQLFAVVRLETQSLDRPTATSVASIVRSVFSVAWMVAPVIASALVASGYPVVTVYGVATLACGTCLMAVQFASKVVTPREAGSDNSLGRILKDLGAWHVVYPLLLAGAVVSGPRLASMIVGLIVVERALGTQVDVGLLAGAMALLEVPFILLAGLATRMLSPAAIIAMGALLYAVFLGALALTSNMGLLYLMAVPGAFGAAIVGSLTIGYLQDLVPHRAGAGSSLISVGGFLGALMASAVFAVGVRTFGYAGAALLGAALVVVGGTLMFLQRSRAASPALTASDLG